MAKGLPLLPFKSFFISAKKGCIFVVRLDDSVGFLGDDMMVVIPCFEGEAIAMTKLLSLLSSLLATVF
jgi:hypothetical protein